MNFQLSKMDQYRSKFAFHDSKDPLMRYLRDRRLIKAIDVLLEKTRTKPSDWDNGLIVCGGVGGEGTFLLNYGFSSITVTDYSKDLLEFLKIRDSRLKYAFMDAQHLEIEDEAFDFVLVQDGLHHLPNPVLGFTEMLRVAKKAVIIIEPHEGIVAKLFGTKIEHGEESSNFVFRWNRWLLRQVAHSYFIEHPVSIIHRRIWDHSLAMLRMTRFINNKYLQLRTIKAVYLMFDLLLGWLGNMMIGITIKDSCLDKKTAKPL